MKSETVADMEEGDEEDVVEPESEETKEKVVEKKEKPAPTTVSTDIESTFRTKLAKNIHRVLFKTAVPDRNELFIPGRMAYVMDLEEEYAESDIPTTLIRSKADCPLAGNLDYTTKRS